MQVLGCDPEVFMVDNAGKFISSVGKIGGSKDQPMPIGDGCSVQEDNVTIEFNTPPCKSVDEYIKYIRQNIDWMTEKAASMNLKLSIVPSAVFTNDELDSDGARTFGCEPDYNAWDYGSVNPKPRAEDPNLRSAGGHIHVQLDDKDLSVLDVVRAMDMFVTLVLMRYDNDTKRRELYGNAGAFRPKPYGLEYRTPSNIWITHDDLITLVWNQVEKAIAYVKAGGNTEDERVQVAINTSNADLAEQLIAEYNVV